jgi:hypothetical protein
VDEVVFLDSFGEICQLSGSGQLTEEDEEGDFQESAFFSKDFNWVASVFENTFVSIDVRDFGGTGDSVHVSGIVSSEDEAFVLDLLEISGLDKTVGNGDFVGFS